MNMERRLKKLNGLQPVYINVDSTPTLEPKPIREAIKEPDPEIKA